MRNLVKSYPAEVVAVNGTSTGPFAPGPASSFNYDLDITMDQRVVTVQNIAPHPYRRWPDAYDVDPFPIGATLTVHLIGTVFIIPEAAELPTTQGCP